MRFGSPIRVEGTVTADQATGEGEAVVLGADARVPISVGGVPSPTTIGYVLAVGSDKSPVWADVGHLPEPPTWKDTTFGMSFDAATFLTDPTGCLTYTDDCADFTPVSSPPSVLGTVGTIGSWGYNDDGSSSNILLNECFYATFDSSGVMHQKLNPNDLAEVIATWNDNDKIWEGSSGASAIASEDTMFVIPTVYLSSSATSIKLSGKSTEGTAYAHTIGGHTYKYLGIGVYESYNNSNVAQSWSGVASTGSVSRPNWRTYSTGKTVSSGYAMIWNWYQFNLWRIMTIFAMKSFNGQSRIGQGGFTYNGGVGQGLCNAMGPFAGSSTATASASTSVKAFIENPWGYKYEFIDDFIHEYDDTTHKVYIGQNAVPTDTPSSVGGTVADKTGFTWSLTSSGWPGVIDTSSAIWGLGQSSGGSTTKGLCDYTYTTTSSGIYTGLVGGYSGNVSIGNAGPSFLYANLGVSNAYTSYGARLAVVFDP